jgi:uncharacterized SAM-binding protein YcdF (DUF218 family)
MLSIFRRLVANRWVKLTVVSAIALWILYMGLKTSLGKSLLSRGLLYFLPDDTGEPVDAIVILGRGRGTLMDIRIEAAIELWERDRASLVFASGEPEAVAMMEALHEQGIPLDNLLGEDCSGTTEENALFTASILQAQGVDDILLLTDEPHMLRSFLTFRSLGFDVIPYPTAFRQSPSTQFPGHVISKEYRGILGYAALGRFFPRSVNGNYLSDTQLNDTRSGYCTVFSDEIDR